MLTIRLKKLGAVRGIYGVNKNLFPTRAAFMHPDAAAAFMKMETEAGPFVYSDILRGAEESLIACKNGRGSQPPGYSGHNFGLAFDIAVEQVLKEKRWKYDKLCGVLAMYGFYPYRQDLSLGPESWHFNFLGDKADAILKKTMARSQWQNTAEESILEHYPNLTPMGAVDIQTCLKKLRLYTGDIDGSLGPISMAAVNLFNQTWNIGANAVGERFQRTLAFIAAERVYVEDNQVS